MPEKTYIGCPNCNFSLKRILDKQKKELIEQFTLGYRCTFCGSLKDGILSKTCNKCLEEN